MKIEIVPVRALSDNYCYLVYRQGAAAACVIDPSAAKEIKAALNHLGLRLELIINTHHHHDHVGGNEDLSETYGAPVYCSATDVKRVPGATRGLRDGEVFSFHEIEFRTLSIPGHTQGQIAYYLPQAAAVFVGDTLFAMGCGRLLEGTPEQMWTSLNRLMELPPATRLYFGHEYTAKNAAFALSVDPTNEEIAKRAEEARKAPGLMVPAPLLADEKRVNPFLHPGLPGIRHELHLETASELEIFAELRRRRDHF